MPTQVSHSTHVSHPDLRRYLNRSIPPAELLDVDDHLSGCPNCRNHLWMIAQLNRLMNPKRDSLEHASTSSGEIHSASPSGQHLSYELIEAHVDGKLRRDKIASHLLRCKNCSEELENLLGFARVCEMSEELADRSAEPGRLEEVGVGSA